MTARIQNFGLGAITSALIALALPPKYIQWGTGSAAAATATALTTAGTTEGRTSGTVTQATTTVTNDTHQVVGTITALTAVSVTEVGVFDAAGTGSPATGGNLWFYSDYGSVSLAIGDSITYTIQTKFS